MIDPREHYPILVLKVTSEYHFVLNRMEDAKITEQTNAGTFSAEKWAVRLAGEAWRDKPGPEEESISSYIYHEATGRGTA